MTLNTISETYRKQQEELHKNPNYGMASVQFAPMVSRLIEQSQVDEVLDYGAGKCRLFENLRVERKLRLQAYDPATYPDPPVPMQLVTCIDVLEHIEPELLDNVLDHLKELTLEIGFFTIHTGAALKVLPDGRNAHLIQEPPSWWLPKILDRWELHSFQKTENGFYVVVTPYGDN